MSGAVRELRPPGVYPTTEEPRARPLTVADTRVAGFVGLAQKGPLDQPCLLGGWNEFLELYGLPSEGYLGRAVEGFFLNGGSRCYVVRVAHRAQPGAVAGPEDAACAETVIPDGWGKPNLRVHALNEGRWGNNVWVRWRTSTAASTLLTLDLEMGAGEARVGSVRGLERGALVRIFDREHSDYVIVTEVEDRTLRWGPVTPVNHRYRAAGPTYLEVIELEVLASLRDRREAFRGLQLSTLSRRYAPRVVNEQSHLIRLEDLRSAAPLQHKLPNEAPAVRLQGGRDGIEGLTAEDFVGHDRGPAERTGMQALAGVDAVSMLCVPDAMLAYHRGFGPQADLDVQRIQDAMVDLCERTRDRFALLDAPPVRDPDLVRKWRRRFDSSFAALYYPWIATQGPGGPVWGPPSGHVAGIFARCDGEFGVHKAPGNEVVRGAVGLMLDLSEEHLGQLNAEGCNALRGLPGRGVRVWGARTMSDDPDWRYVNVRRLFIMLRRSLEEGTQWAVFEPNGPPTWEALTREAAIFLKDLWAKGYFAGDTAEQSFFVRCDERTNPPEVLEAGQLVMELGVAPAIPAEYLVFSVIQEMGERSADSSSSA